MGNLPCAFEIDDWVRSGAVNHVSIGRDFGGTFFCFLPDGLGAGAGAGVDIDAVNKWSRGVTMALVNGGGGAGVSSSEDVSSLGAFGGGFEGMVVGGSSSLDSSST